MLQTALDRSGLAAHARCMTSTVLAFSRRSRWAALLPLGLLALAGANCGGGSGTGGPRSDNGQTGSIGSAECQVDADCQREADGIVAQLVSEGNEAAVRTAKCVDGGLCDTVLRKGSNCYV